MHYQLLLEWEAIAIIRVSGKKTFEITQKIFSKSIVDKVTHTAHFGLIKDDETIIDEVLLTVFKNPKSFTGEDSVEITCHGSVFSSATNYSIVNSFRC